MSPTCMQTQLFNVCVWVCVCLAMSVSHSHSKASYAQKLYINVWTQTDLCVLYAEYWVYEERTDLDLIHL